MKKFFAASALAFACVFLFAACSAQVETAISANWHLTYNDYESDFYEKLEYEVGFNGDGLDGVMKIDVDSDNSSYIVTAEAAPSVSATYKGTTATYRDVYKLTSALTISARYTVTEGEKETEVSFGGKHDKNPANDPNEDFQADDADTVVTEVWFASVRDDRQLRPIKSVQTVRSHGYDLSKNGAPVLTMSYYTVSVAYDEKCENAEIVYEDRFADLTDADRKDGSFVKTALGRKNKTVGGLQKEYSCFDNAQLFFAGRGMTFASGSSVSVSVLSGTAPDFPQTMILSCTEMKNVKYEAGKTFTIDGKEAVGDIAAAVVSFLIPSADSGGYAGEPITVTYAQKPASGENTYRNLPLSINVPAGYTLGNYVYTLESAVYAKDAVQG